MNGWRETTIMEYDTKPMGLFSAINTNTQVNE